MQCKETITMGTQSGVKEALKLLRLANSLAVEALKCRCASAGCIARYAVPGLAPESWSELA